MKKIAIVSIGSWSKFAVPVEKLSKFISFIEEFDRSDTAWINDRLYTYLEPTTISVELINTSEVRTKAQIDDLREEERQQKLREAEAEEV